LAKEWKGVPHVAATFRNPPTYHRVGQRVKNVKAYYVEKW